MKYTDEYLKKICDNKDLEFISTEILYYNKKRRRICNYICNKHKQYGIQQKPVEKIENIKKPCIYCNHSMLNITIKDEIDSNIELLGEYKGFETYIPCRCKIHNEYFDGIPSVLLNGGTGCKICAYIKLWDSRGRRTTKEAKELLESINENLIVVGEYNGSHEYIECECRIHNIRWKSIFCNLLNKTAICPICALEHATSVYRLTDDEVLEKLNANIPYIKMIDKYKGKNYEILFHCDIHNIDFKSKPKSFLYGASRGCPLCTSSLGEKKLQRYLESIGVNFKTQYTFKNCRNIRLLRFDAYDLDNNIAFEYQGQQHYIPVCFNGISEEEAQNNLKDTIKRDKIKTDFCKNNNIKLVKIPYWEYDNMENFIETELRK